MVSLLMCLAVLTAPQVEARKEKGEDIILTKHRLIIRSGKKGKGGNLIIDDSKHSSHMEHFGGYDHHGYF